MKLVGFNFTKISVERLKGKLENVKVKTNIDVPEITSVKSDVIKTEEDLLGAHFTFVLEYSPDVAKIEFSGNMVVAVDSTTAKEVLKNWKEKQTPEDFRLALFNIILKKSTLRALQLEEEINLPLHVQLPSLQKQKQE